MLFFDVFFFQAEDGIRDLVRSRGLGDVYKRQDLHHPLHPDGSEDERTGERDRDLEVLTGVLDGVDLSLIHI